MRTILSLAVTASLALVGCGSEAEPEGVVAPSVVAPVATEVPATREASRTPTASATASAAVTGTPEATSEPTSAPTSAPTAEPTVEPAAEPAETQPVATAPAATAAPTEAAPSAPPAPAALSGVVANIEGFGYPYELQVAAGTTVTWVNHDTALHDVVAYDGSWASALLEQGQSYSWTFPTAGRYAYTCSIHPYMQAAVVVE